MVATSIAVGVSVRSFFAGRTRSIEPFETPLWKDSGLAAEYRLGTAGSILLAQSYGPTDSTQSNPLSEPGAPIGVIYKFTKSDAVWQVSTTHLGEWEETSTPIACLQYPWKEQAGLFKFDWEKRKVAGNDPVRVAGASVVSAVISPDGMQTAVISAAGHRRERTGLVAAGGSPSEYAGPIFVQLFRSADGLQIGPTLRLGEAGTTQGVPSNWLPDGSALLCVDAQFRRIWVVPISKFVER